MKYYICPFLLLHAAVTFPVSATVNQAHHCCVLLPLTSPQVLMKQLIEEPHWSQNHRSVLKDRKGGYEAGEVGGTTPTPKYCYAPFWLMNNMIVLLNTPSDTKFPWATEIDRGRRGRIVRTTFGSLSASVPQKLENGVLSSATVKQCHSEWMMFG